MVDYSASELKQKAPLLEQCLSRGVQEGEFAGASFLLAKDNEELVYVEKGFADLEQHKPIRRDSIYRCYSLTKTVTAVAIMSLVEEGRLDLRDPVERYFSSFANAKVQSPQGPVPARGKMTVQDLLNMTSGLGYGAGDDASNADDRSAYTNTSAAQVSAVLQEAQRRLDSTQPMTTQEFAERLGHCTLAFEPGTSWCYGVSADILGAIAERITGKTYGEFLQERIFDPLEMTDTGFYVPQDKKARLVNVYAASPAASSAVPVPTQPGNNDARHSRLLLYQRNDLCIRNDGAPNPLESGGAGLFSTIDDFFRFTQMLLRGGRGMNGSRILRLGTVQFMTRHALLPAPQLSFEKHMPGLEGFTYANLLRIMQHPEYAATISREGEYGWDGALGTYWCNSPTDGVTILLMMNQKGYETGRVTHMLRNIVFG